MGDQFEGVWNRGLRSHGTYVYANGDAYCGGFANNQKHGHGLAREGRDVFEVLFEHDVLVRKRTAASVRPNGRRDGIVSRRTYDSAAYRAAVALLRHRSRGSSAPVPGERGL